MAIPKYDGMYRVLLDCLADMQPHGSREVRDAIAVRLSVSEAERQELLPSGRQAVFDNRVGWTQKSRAVDKPQTRDFAAHGAGKAGPRIQSAKH